MTKADVYFFTFDLSVNLTLKTSKTKVKDIGLLIVIEKTHT